MKNMEHLVLSLLITIFVSFGIVTLLLFFIFKQIYKYWDKFDIPVITPQIPYGSLGNPVTNTTPGHEKIANAYKTFKEKSQRHGGIFIYFSPFYVPVDPVIIKNILIKDFNHFSDRIMYDNKKHDPLSFNLLTAEGQEWKDMRNKLHPLFTINKLKLMFPLFQTHNDRLVKIINDYVRRMEPVELKDLIGCFTTDIIGSSSFGIDCNSLEHPNCKFRNIGKKIFHLTPFRFLKGIFTRGFPNMAKFLGLVTFPKDVSAFFMRIVDDTIDYRIKNNVKYNDFFQSLMELEKNETNDSVRKTNIAAQSLLFYNAGFETTSSTITHAVYEIACNPQIQEKLRKEVTSVLEKHNGIITYEALLEMEYLSRVVDETLRKYPPLATVPRKCVQDYHVEGTNVVIEKGVKVCISILGIHRDPEYYPNPEVFDPERFNETNKSKRPPCTYLPFIDGPRNCIGLKFGLIQVKLGLANLLNNFKFSINPKTGSPVMDSRSFVYRFSTNIYIDFEKI